MGMLRLAGVLTPALAILLATPTKALAALMKELLRLDRCESNPFDLELMLPDEDRCAASTTMTTSEEDWAASGGA